MRYVGQFSARSCLSGQIRRRKNDLNEMSSGRKILLAGILPRSGTNRYRRGSFCNHERKKNCKEHQGKERKRREKKKTGGRRWLFPHHVCRGQPKGGGAGPRGAAGGRGQAGQAGLRRAGGVGQTVSQAPVLVLQGRGGLGHPGLGLLQEGPRLRTRLLPLQPGVLIILSLLGRGSALALSRRKHGGLSRLHNKSRKRKSKGSLLTMGILTISPDSLWLCEPAGGRKRKEESGVGQGVLEQRNSADGRRTRGTLTWYLMTALDDEPPHGQAGEDEEDEEDQGNGERENWKRNKNAHQLKFLTADGPDQSENSPKSGEEEVGPGVGRTEDGLVGDGSRFRHTVLEKGVHSFTSTSPDLHLEI